MDDYLSKRLAKQADQHDLKKRQSEEKTASDQRLLEEASAKLTEMVAFFQTKSAGGPISVLVSRTNDGSFLSAIVLDFGGPASHFEYEFEHVPGQHMIAASFKAPANAYQSLVDRGEVVDIRKEREVTALLDRVWIRVVDHLIPIDPDPPTPIAV